MSLDVAGPARRPGAKLPACPDDNRQHWTTVILLRIRRLGVRVPPSAPHLRRPGSSLRCERRPFYLPRASASHNLSQLLGDLVNASKGPAALLQVIVARVDVGALGERGVVVPCP